MFVHEDVNVNVSVNFQDNKISFFIRGEKELFIQWDWSLEETKNFIHIISSAYTHLERVKNNV